MDNTEKNVWRKTEKNIYIPKTKPMFLSVPSFKFFTVSGKGDPNTTDGFKLGIGALYSLSFTIKMSPKSGNPPKNYSDYTVYPLEAVWNIPPECWEQPTENDDFKQLNKCELEYKIMIRQPEFVSEEYADFVLEMVKRKNPSPTLDIVKFETLTEGDSVQMLHVGPYEEEKRTLDAMVQFTEENSLVRTEPNVHREIYLSDPNRTKPENLKTVLRFSVKHK